jgi:GT2 family glycosyltransferase
MILFFRIKNKIHRLLGKTFTLQVAPDNHQTTVDDWTAYYGKRAEIYSENANTETPKVSILVLTYNNLHYTKLCLKSIYCNTTYPNYEVIVADNASSDKTPEWLGGFAQTHSNMKLILNKKNLGFAAGNNQMAREASGEYVIFLNNDTVVTKRWVEGLLAYMQNDPSVGLVGPVTNSTGNEARILTDYISLSELDALADNLKREMANQSFDIRMLAFYCVMARKNQFEEIGGLDERFLVGMFEDDDLAVRYHQAGLRVLCAEDVFIHHFQSVSFAKLEDETYQKIFSENRKKYEEKWGRAWKPYQSRQKFVSPPLQRKEVTLKSKGQGILKYRCNICGQGCETPMDDLGREKPSCKCGSTVRSRAVIHLLSMELFGHSLALPDFPIRPNLLGWGMSDGIYANLLSQKIGYTNTFYHQEPRFDITASLDSGLEGSLDFLISTEVFEHIEPPVSRGFLNAYRLLKPTGFFIFTVPYTLEDETREHFPKLYQYEILKPKSGTPILKNITRDGQEQLYNNLIFHGGPGATLEMRVFSQDGLIAEMKQAGFGSINIYSEPCWEFGIYWSQPWSLPLIARPLP